MDLYVIRRAASWASPQELEATAAKSAKIGEEEMADQVRWIRSYVVEEPDGQLGTVCIYEARDQASIRETCAARRNARRRHPADPEDGHRPARSRDRIAPVIAAADGSRITVIE
jgi:hypothetical protein